MQCQPSEAAGIVHLCTKILSGILPFHLNMYMRVVQLAVSLDLSVALLCMCFIFSAGPVCI